jgi:hypothetical protein
VCSRRPVGGHGALEARRLGPRVIRVEATTLMFSDPDSGELLRTGPNPLTRDEIHALQRARPAGPPPRARTELITVQRRVRATV